MNFFNMTNLIGRMAFSSFQPKVTCTSDTSPETRPKSPSASMAPSSCAQSLESPSVFFQVEVDPGCQMFYEGGPGGNDLDLFAACTKNPGHPGFIPVLDFCIDHLPLDLRTQENLDTILQWTERTVKISGMAISPDRPEVFPQTSIPFPCANHRGRTDFLSCGTGFIAAIKQSSGGKPCTCRKCRRSESPKTEFFEIYIKTAAHVVYDDFEAGECVVECFFDSNTDRKSIKRLYGLSAASSPFCDTATMTCTSHDADLVSRLQAIISRDLSTLHSSGLGECWGVMISHPHGRSKHIALGNFEVAYLISEKKKSPVVTPSPSSWKDYLNPNYLQELFNPATRIRVKKRPNAWPELKVVDVKNAENPIQMDAEFEMQYGYTFDMSQEADMTKMLTSPKRHLVYHRVNHDISTCPGSSGAPTLLSSLEGDGSRSWVKCPSDFTHSGACLNNGNNRSGYASDTIPILFPFSFEVKKDNTRNIKETKEKEDSSVAWVDFVYRPAETAFSNLTQLIVAAFLR